MCRRGEPSPGSYVQLRGRGEPSPGADVQRRGRGVALLAETDELIGAEAYVLQVRRYFACKWERA